MGLPILTEWLQLKEILGEKQRSFKLWRSAALKRLVLKVAEKKVLVKFFTYTKK